MAAFTPSGGWRGVVQQPHLIEKIITFFTNKVKSQDLELIKIYLSNKEENPRYINAYAFVKQSESNLKYHLFLAQHYIHRVIPYALVQALDVDYELATSSKLAVLFITSDESTIRETSPYSNPHETMLFTMLCYLRRR